MTAIATQLPQTADDAATINGWSDRYAATIIARTPKRITVRTDKATLLNGPGSGEADALQVTPGGFAAHWSGQQRYAYETDLDGAVETFTLRKSGRWIRTGESDVRGARSLTVGRRAHHYDFNF